MKTKEMYCRGKRIDCDMWEYGYLVDNIYGAKYPMIIYSSEYNDGNNVDIDYNFVCGETVGRYTGLIDKNNIMIYEGDIIQYYAMGKLIIGAVKICEEDFTGHRGVCIKYHDGSGTSLLKSNRDFIVIGNIHDNPELLRR